jgi:hypothetical protein
MKFSIVLIFLISFCCIFSCDEIINVEINSFDLYLTEDKYKELTKVEEITPNHENVEILTTENDLEIVRIGKFKSICTDPKQDNLAFYIITPNEIEIHFPKDNYSYINDYSKNHFTCTDNEKVVLSIIFATKESHTTFKNLLISVNAAVADNMEISERKGTILGTAEGLNNSDNNGKDGIKPKSSFRKSMSFLKLTNKLPSLKKEFSIKSSKLNLSGKNILNSISSPATLISPRNKNKNGE